MNILEFVGWSVAILLVSGLVIGFALAVYRETGDRRMNAAITKWLEANHDNH